MFLDDWQNAIVFLIYKKATLKTLKIMSPITTLDIFIRTINYQQIREQIRVIPTKKTNWIYQRTRVQQYTYKR